MCRLGQRRSGASTIPGLAGRSTRPATECAIRDDITPLCSSCLVVAAACSRAGLRQGSAGRRRAAPAAPRAPDRARRARRGPGRDLPDQGRSARLEAEELVQVTAEVEGAVSDVRFHEGDRVGRRRCSLRIDPDRYRLEAERAEARLPEGAGRRRRAPQPTWQRREALAREQLVAAEELNRARGETERLAAEAESAQGGARHRPRRTCGAPRCARRAAGVINTKSSRPASS